MIRGVISVSLWLIAVSVIAVINFSWAPYVRASQEGLEMPVQEKGRIRAPELTGHRGWLNTDKPLSLSALRGKVVLLDFWTYGCINCMHIIPDLKRLEKKYPNELVVIGVHSAKFENEKETENIRRIILRYEIEHPIVNDADFAIWKAYAVDAWPTRYLIDPAGYIIGRLSGEGGYDVLDGAIAQAIEEFRKRGELNEQPLKLVLERAKVGDLPIEVIRHPDVIGHDLPHMRCRTFPRKEIACAVLELLLFFGESEIHFFNGL